MKKILFVCYGNQCRSPMAEYLFNNMLVKAKLNNEYRAESAGVWPRINFQSANTVVLKLLAENGIDCSMHEAKPFMRSDTGKYEYIVCMDDEVLREVLFIAGIPADMYENYHKGRCENPPEVLQKICKLLDFTERPGEDISDPMITGDFEKAWDEVVCGCKGLFTKVVLNESL